MIFVETKGSKINRGYQSDTKHSLDIICLEALIAQMANSNMTITKKKILLCISEDHLMPNFCSENCKTKKK